MSRVAVVFGQYGALADPLNLPTFRNRLVAQGVETILIQHDDSQKAYDFLHGYEHFCGLVGASLGAMSVAVMAGQLAPQTVHFVGGFQPSDWDPSGHMVCIKSGLDVITRAVTVPANVKQALCFRNPILAMTGGLGHATYVLEDAATKIEIVERTDVHPGDFGVAQDQMVETVMKAIIACK